MSQQIKLEEEKAPELRKALTESNFTVYRAIKSEKKDQSMEEEVVEEKV